MFYEVIPGKGVSGLDTALTYRADEVLAPGTLVEVPVGRTKMAGVVVKKVAQPSFECKEISRILYSKPLPRHLVATVKWISEYYQAPLASCLGVVLPNGVLKNRRKKFSTGPADFSSPTSLRLRGGPPPKSSPVGSINDGSQKTEQTVAGAEIELNQAQKNAIKGLQEARGATKLLFGVTGSGKTNVYLHEALNAFKGQKSVILLVPEIALTGQLVRVFQEVFGEAVTMIHSKQTEAERHLIFEDLLLSETPRIVVGPRSALFAPLANLGLIIIDEEHEGTYSQESAPRYSAVRVASFMARELKISCILGSATPAISDYYLAKEHGTLVPLKTKAKKGAKKAEITVVDFKKREEFSRNKYFSDKLLRAMAKNLTAGRQTLIFHNRRGSAPLTICEHCGHEIVCPNCFLPLTLHADEYELHCHTCGYHEKVPFACPKCGGMGLVHKGFGTKLLETELTHLFPRARIMRFDADSKKGEALEAVYEEVRDGEVDILVGTQTVAKGLDLPRLATVGVVQADAGLSLPDFAAEERVFQLLTQVIGRVGRGHTEVAEVFIQTFRPDHPVLKYAISEDYEKFAEYLLKARKASGFPPYKYVMKLSLTAGTEATALRKVREAVGVLSEDARLLVSPPVPAFHERTAQGFTWEIVVRATARGALVEACGKVDPKFRAALDPGSLL